MDAEAFQLFKPFAISLIIGLVIGLERERSHRPHSQSLGMRTFALLGMLGSLTASLESSNLQFAIALFALGAILLGYWKSARAFKRDPQLGLTTEIAGAIVYGLGILSAHHALLSAVLALTVLLLLIGKSPLHHFARKSLSSQEIRAFVTLLIIAIGVIPALPNRTIDPWDLINPQRLGVILIVLASLQFGGYVAVRLWGHRIGTAITGLLGGFISSTIVFVNAARLSQHHSHSPAVAISACLSAVSSYLMLWIVVAITYPALALALAPCLTALLLSGVFLSWIGLKGAENKSNPKSEYSNPLDLRSVTKLTVFFAGMLALVGVAQQQLGSTAVHLISLIGGLFELHSTTVASANLLHQNLIDMNSAKENIALALLGSFASKYFITLVLMKGPSQTKVSSILLGMLVSGCIGYFAFL